MRQTGAESAEAAINWVFENSDRNRAEELEANEDLYQDYKMVFAVNMSLPMSPGKVAAQVTDFFLYMMMSNHLSCHALDSD